jgi:DNA invertase Pin-like site-specific DNA recombinase
VSTEEQADSRAGLEAQRAAIEVECERRGWQVVGVLEDAGYSAKDVRRPGVRAALEELERGRADALVVAKLDRLSRSMLDFTAVMARAQAQRWALVALDCAVDTTTPARRGDGARARDLRAVRAAPDRPTDARGLSGEAGAGVRLGRPPTIAPGLARRIRALRSGGTRCRRSATG